MNKSYLIIFQMLFFILSSCERKTTVIGHCTLQQADTCITLAMDSWTKEFFYMQQITDEKDGTEYLIFQNATYPQLLYYNKQTRKFVKRINFPDEGPDAVRRFRGFIFHDMNEIYLTEDNGYGISLVDGSGKLLCFYDGKTDKGEPVYVNSGMYDIIGDSIFYDLSINREAAPHERLVTSPFCAVFDLKTHQFHTLPFTYFDVAKVEEETYYSIEHSRCYTGKSFVYAFRDMEFLYETDILHKKYRKIRARSKYLRPMEVMEKQIQTYDRDKSFKRSLARGRYGKILYDFYRHVYYRVVFPPSEVPGNVNLMDFKWGGGHAFSIMILDEKFNILDEVMLPKDTYCPYPMFVDKDGLYIHQSHILDPNYSDDVCIFRLFTLVDKK